MTVTSVALVSLCLFLVSSRAANPLCSNPGFPSNGRIITTDHTKETPSAWYEVGDKISFECNDGYRLVGNGALTCLQVGQGTARWSNKVPLCEKSRTVRAAKCSKPKDIINGVVKLTKGLAVKSIARYSCSEGFKLSRYGSSSRICLTGGRGWSGTPPYCEKDKTKKPCVHSSRFTNGRVRVTKTRRQSIATYSCNSGYKLFGPTVRVCSTGKWSGRFPSCRSTGVCLKLSNPSNGDVVTTGLTFDSKATYSCDDGFELTGNEERTCQNNGHWSGYPPTCRKNCEMLPSPPNGNVYVKGLVVDSYATYSCNIGYKLEGDKTRQCAYGGTWTKAQPNCKRICKDLSAPKYGSVDINGLRAEYSCDDEYELVGNKIVTCLNIGRWSSRKKPICRIRPKKCEMLPAPNNGQVNVDEGLIVGSKAMYSCDSGFDLTGYEVRECLNDGKWSDSEPYCKPEVKQCDKLKNPRHGKVVVRGDGSVARYYCKRGFVLKGNRDRKLHCQADGKWAGKEPICKHIRCRKPKAPRHGRVRANGNVAGSRARYFCRPGFKIGRGPRVRRCESNRRWSGPTPSCVLAIGGGFKRLGNLFRPRRIIL